MWQEGNDMWSRAKSGSSSPAPSSLTTVNLWLAQPKYLDLDNGQDVRIYRSVYMRTDGTDVQLVNLKTDNTESVITIHASIAAYLSSFRIMRVRVVTANMFIIEYTWTTGELTNGGHIFRIINIGIDGALYQSGELSIVAGDSTATAYEGRLIRSLLNKTIPAKLTKQVTRSNGNTALYCYDSYTAWKAPTLSFQNTFVNISAGANVYMPPLDRCVSIGGLIYRNNSNVDYIATTMGTYGGGNTSITLANAGSDIAALGSTNHYVLGFSEGGLFITVQIQNDTALVYIWIMDTRNASVKLLGNTSFTLGTAKIISFEHNIFTLDNGKRYRLYLNTSLNRFELEDLGTLILSVSDPFAIADLNLGSNESDLWEGILIW